MTNSAHDDHTPGGISRGTFLALGGAAAAAAGLGAVGLSGAPAHAAPSIQRLGEVTGPGRTDLYGANATDLGIPALAPDGRMLTVFGDTFDGPAALHGDNRAPIALYSDPARPLADRIIWTGAVGGDYAAELVPYDLPVTTMLPGDVITLGDTMYLWLMANHGFGNVDHTEVWISKDSGATWQFGARMFGGAEHGGLMQQATWVYSHEDDHVYVLTTGFQRDKPIILHRVFGGAVLDPSAYEPWGYANGAWGWGNPPTPVLEGSFGEMCWRIVEGTWVLSWFNAGEGTVDVLLHDGPTANLHEATHHQLLHHVDWGFETETGVSQLYGGYIVPGSTLDDLHLLVSQWNTNTQWPYWTQQFRVRGLAD
jgi:hypothetical protein